MSGVPSAFILVLDEVLVMPEGVVIVLDLLMVAPLFVVVADLLMPAGLVMVLDLVVVLVAGVCAVVLVDTFEELVLILVVEVAGMVAAGVWARAAVPPSRLKESRKPRMRFMRRNGNKNEKMDVIRGSKPRRWLAM